MRPWHAAETCKPGPTRAVPHKPTRPPGRVERMAWVIDSAVPAHSGTASAPTPPARSVVMVLRNLPARTGGREGLLSGVLAGTLPARRLPRRANVANANDREAAGSPADPTLT